MVALPTQTFYHFFFESKTSYSIYFFKKKSESIRKMFNDEKFLTVHELHVYENSNLFCDQ